MHNPHSYAMVSAITANLPRPGRDASDVRVLIAHKSFTMHSHTGLGITGINAVRVLRHVGIDAHVRGCNDAKHLAELVAAERWTHVIICALWVATPELSALVAAHPDVQFGIVSHSNWAFLQADPNAVKLIREALALAASRHNLAVGGNDWRFCESLSTIESTPTLLLPNLYDCIVPPRHGAHAVCPRTLRVGCFGAPRELKNVVTAAAAALVMAQRSGCDLELHMNSGREEGVAMTAVKQLLTNRPNARLVQTAWTTWAGFLDAIAHVDVCLHPSFTESFMVVVADGIMRGVPSVVGETIGWVPSSWHAAADDANDIARVGLMLRADPRAAHDGYEALVHHVRRTLPFWYAFLGVE